MSGTFEWTKNNVNETYNDSFKRERISIKLLQDITWD